MSTVHRIDLRSVYGEPDEGTPESGPRAGLRIDVVIEHHQHDIVGDYYTVENRFDVDGRHDFHERLIVSYDPTSWIDDPESLGTLELAAKAGPFRIDITTLNQILARMGLECVRTS